MIRGMVMSSCVVSCVMMGRVMCGIYIYIYAWDVIYSDIWLFVASARSFGRAFEFLKLDASDGE